MYCLLKICNRISIQNVVKAKFDYKLVTKLCIKDELKTSVKKFTSLLKPRNNVKLFIPGSFVIASGFIKVAHCQSKNPVNSLKIAKSENDHPPFPWAEFFTFLKRFWLLVLGVILGTITLAFINIKIPIMLGEVVNVLVEFVGQSTSKTDFLRAISKPATTLLSLYGLQGLMTTLCISLLFNLSENISAKLKEQLFATLVVQDMAFFDENKTSDLIYRLTVDIQEFKSSFKLIISQGLKNIVQTTGCVISLAMISPKLTLYLIGLMSLLITGGTLIGSGLRILSRKAQSQSGKLSLIAEEVLGNMKTVRAFASEHLEIENFERESKKTSELNKLLGLGIAAFQGISNVALNGLVLFTLCMGGFLMTRDEINAGSLMSFLVASQTIQKSLNKLSLMYGISIQGMNAGARVFEFLLLNPGETLKGNKHIRYHSLHCDIDFKDVSFTYPTRKDHPVLQDFSLAIKGGQKIALVGPSGGGKSTVVSLLERLYETDSGSITIDGIDLKELNPAWLRGRLIGYIGQEPVLFATTIRENIRYGKPNANEHEIVEAAKQANAHEFIMSFPEGYDTVVGERGQSISGGQKQRIAIARALIKNPPILILDEATSALDVESERVIQESIDTISKGRTLIIVAHRLSTIKDVDIVAVILDGKIVEIGKPEDLKKQKGIFWNLTKGQ